MGDDGTSERATLAERYELGPVLGRGGMGTVRDATDLRLGRSVAVKILRPDLADQARARRRFETEARAAARLAHPNVVTVFDSGEDAGVPFLVMERLPGRTLAEELASGPLPFARVRDIAREILSALDAAHRAGIIHRDIKPGNVLLTADGHVKVSDFGIAKAVDDADQTQTTDLVATLSYLAPERLTGAQASARSDLYSVGVLLYEALAGRRPFAEATPLAEMRAIERAQPEPLTTLQPGVPDDLATMIERAMARDPERRYDSAAQMAEAIVPAPDPGATVPLDALAHADTRPVDASAGAETVRIEDLPTADAPRASAPPPPPAPLTDDAPPHHGTPMRRRAALGAVVVIVAVVIATALVVNRRDGGRAGPSTPSTTVGAPAPTTSLPLPLEGAIQRLEQDVK